MADSNEESVDTARHQGRLQLIWRSLKFYVAFTLELLAAGMLIYLWPYLSELHPAFSVALIVPVLLILLLLALWIFWVGARLYQAERLPHIIFNFSTLDEAQRRFVIVAAVFYIGLIFTLIVTSPFFEEDWAIVFIAALPLVYFLVNAIIERADSIRAKVAGVELEVHQVNAQPYLPKTDLSADEIRTVKGKLSELESLVQRAKSAARAPRVLAVEFGTHTINLAVLRQYVYTLSAETRLEYIAFTENGRYLGFMSVSQFKAQFPEISLDWLLALEPQDLRQFSRQTELFTQAHELEEVLGLLSQMQTAFQRPGVAETFRKLSVHLYGTEKLVRPSSLKMYGVSTASVPTTTVSEVYQQLKRHNLTAIPVVDEDGKFVGMVSLEDVARQLMDLIELHVSNRN